MPLSVSDLPPGSELRSARVGHLPVVREAIDTLGIHSVLSRLLPGDGRMVVRDADCVSLMILNILHGRVALYRMNEWLDTTDVGVVLGEDCPPDAFHDDRLAGTLDRLAKFGVDDVLTEVVTSYLKSDACPKEYTAHSDTTTLKLYGAYEVELEHDAPRPAQGYSKDHRPDLKQLVYGLTLQGAVGVPMCISMFDGNTSDHVANRFQIDRLAGLLPPEHDVTLVHDCKLFDPDSVGHVLDSAFHFVTLVPRSYSLRSELVDWAVDMAPELPELVREPGRTKTRPDRVYRGMSTTRSFTVVGPDTGAQDRPLRFVVVASSQLAAAFDKKLKGKLERDRKGFEKALSRAARQKFGCKHDANAAVAKLPKPKLHRAHIEVVSEIETLPRKRRGRPKKGEQPPTRIIYRLKLRSIEVDQDRVQQARKHARHFVLATDHLDTETWPDERILRTYRHQHIIEGHTGFRWLKGPAAAAPMFLKTPHRIAALGLVFVLALMVRNYIQWMLRSELVKREETLPNMNNQPTQRPTTESAFRLFTNVAVVLVIFEERVIRRFLQGTTEHTDKVLELLGMPKNLLTRPRRKCLRFSVH